MAAQNDDTFTHFISIDFGTSGCGIAMATKESKSDIKLFTAWEGASIGVKCPTVLLLDPEEKFEMFGVNAIALYEKKTNLRNPSRADEYLLFQKFKMHLYKKSDGKEPEIEAMNGKKISLIKVFELSLKHIKEVAMKWLRINFDNPGRKVQWIITVPAIWSPAAKQFMRKAAAKAGFDEKSLVFALEPALSCLQNLIDIKKVTKASYLVVDCGGGTVDIAAHKMSIDGKGEFIIEELSPPNGDNCGGFAVNEEFELMLQDIFGLSAADFKAVKEKHARHWRKMVWSDFEESKCRIEPGQTTASITIVVHKAIREEVKQIKKESVESLVEAYKQRVVKRDVEWDSEDEGIVLPYSTICSLFSPTLKKITVLINDVLLQCQTVEMVLLVGGFAESPLLFDEVNKNFPNLEVKRSLQPLFSVANGAVKFGLNKDFINCRVMKNSIGIETSVEYQEGDDEQYIEESGGQKYRTKAFWHLVRANQKIYTRDLAEFLFRPLTEEQPKCVVSIYESPQENVKYVHDAGCKLMGKIEIEIPKFTEDESREIKVVIDFAKTEHNVLAFSGSGHSKQLTAKLTFLPTAFDEYQKDEDNTERIQKQINSDLNQVKAPAANQPSQNKVPVLQSVEKPPLTDVRTNDTGSSSTKSEAFIVYAKEEYDPDGGQVLCLSNLLRECGIACAIDLYHTNDNISHWSSWVEKNLKCHIASRCGFIILVCSPTMFSVLERDDNSRVEMAAGYIDCLTLKYYLGQSVKKFLPLCINDSPADCIPPNLSGKTCYHFPYNKLVSQIPEGTTAHEVLNHPDFASLRSLVATLTGQQENPTPNIGLIPVLQSTAKALLTDVRTNDTGSSSTKMHQLQSTAKASFTGVGTNHTASSSTKDEGLILHNELIDIVNKISIVETNDSAIQNTIQILLVTANETECNAALTSLNPLGGYNTLLRYHHVNGRLKRNAIYIFGRFGYFNAAVHLMTKQGPAAAQDVVTMAADCFGNNLNAIFAVGVACGVEGKSEMLDVLVPKTITFYTKARISTSSDGEYKIENRGPTNMPVSLVLLSYFDQPPKWPGENSIAGRLKKKPTQLSGNILSGNYLVDNAKFKKKLLKTFACDAIGIEMEGAGLFEDYPDTRYKIMVIKGVCDFGDGNKNKGYQPTAAMLAVECLMHYIGKSPNLPHKLAEACGNYGRC